MGWGNFCQVRLKNNKHSGHSMENFVLISIIRVRYDTLEWQQLRKTFMMPKKFASNFAAPS